MDSLQSSVGQQKAVGKVSDYFLFFYFEKKKQKTASLRAAGFN